MEEIVFDPTSEKEREEFFGHGYRAHLPGYTGHCPTLKFRVGKRFGASTEEIIKELLEKRILKTGPYRPSFSKSIVTPISCQKDVKAELRDEIGIRKVPPYILGYTGYIPGFNNKYGLPFMKAIEEGAKEWRIAQYKLRSRKDAMRSYVEKMDTRNLSSRARTDNVEMEISHANDAPQALNVHISPDRLPIVGYTGHIPGAKGEISLSKRYALVAKKGLELAQRERMQRFDEVKSMHLLPEILGRI